MIPVETKSTIFEISKILRFPPFWTPRVAGHPGVGAGVWVPVVKSHHYKVLNRPENQRYGCYGDSRVPYAPRKYVESTGNEILWTSYTADFFSTPSELGDRSI